MKQTELRGEIAMRLPESMHFSPEGPGIWVGTRKYFRQDELVHEHDFFELVLVRSGSGLHVTESGEYPVRHGGLFLVKPGCAHGYRGMNHLEIVNILYLPERLKFEMFDLRDNPGFHALFGISTELPDDYRFRNSLTLDSDRMAMAETIVRELEIEQYLARPGWIFAMNNGFMRLVLLLSRAVAETAERNDELGRLNRILGYIAEHDGESLQPAEIARACGISVRTLERIFADTLHRTPNAWLNDRRLSRGAELLTATDRTVTEIALACGFSDGNYFSKMFSRKFALSPREYRRKFATKR
ncbi:MAG: helix-turn-helix domain-containing protein [Lentisphaeria bacterium]|nr:helix-turn-helix domain-containing protein [Lentisphaeria bacterium]